MKRKFSIFFGLVLALLVPAAAQAAPETTRLDVSVKDADAALYDNWLGMYAHGKKIGFLHEAIDKVKTADGTVLYRKRMEAQLKLVALGEKGEIKGEQSLVFSSRPPFALRSGDFVSDDGASKKSIRLEAKGTGYEATVTIGKETRTSTLTNVDFTLADVLSPALWLKKGPARGETITVADFDFGDLYMGKISMKLLDTKEMVHAGAKMVVREVEKIDYEARTKGTSIMGYDSDALPVSGVLGGMFELRRESETEARKTEFSKDLIFETLVKLDRPVGDMSKVTGLTLRGKGKVNGLLPQTTLQKIIHEGGDNYVVKIGTRHGTKAKATEAERRKGLEATTAYPINDAKVIELARKAIGDATTDREKVERLCKFVHEYVKYEIVYLPSVQEIMDRKAGDCKSYALLFTCLARAAGLPAREACGYLYLDELKGFGGHAWSEVVIDGHWTPVDATVGDTNLRPFYICLGTGPEGNDNMSRSSGKLSFELVEVERAP